MTANEAIVNPVRGNNPPDPGFLSLLISTTGDIDRLCGVLGINKTQFRSLFISRLYPSGSSGLAVSLTGPIVGAPYAVMILETLIAWGTQGVLFYGWCGAVSPDVKIGDIIIPTGAFIDEGTSKHYFEGHRTSSHPSSELTAYIRSVLVRNNIAFKEGDIWSTDAIFRETKDKVRHHQHHGVLAVEMELSALFSVAEYRQVEIAGILVVSDDLSTLKWRPGFREASFRQARDQMCQALKHIVNDPENLKSANNG